MINIQKHMSILGKEVEDSVTKLRGVVTAVSFDLYGCIQTIVHPGKDKDGNLRDTLWFDISRLKILSEKPVMDVPDFNYGIIAEGKKGPSEKPMMMKA